MIPASTTKRARTRRWADGRRARPIAKARRCGEDDPARRHPTGATTPAIVAGSTRGPSLRLPIGNQSRREGGGYIQTGLEGEHPASSGTPRALETIGIHLKIALGLSNEVGPPQSSAGHPAPCQYQWHRSDISPLAKGTNRVRVRGGVTPAPDGKDNDLGISCRKSHPVPFRPPSVPTTSGGTAASPVESNHSTGLEEREGTGCAESAPSSSRRRRIHATAAACAVWPAEAARAPPGSRRDRRLRDCFGDRAAG